MRIKKLNIYGFGKFVQKKINFDKGIQVFYGENEAGKSTLFAFIHAILFGMPSKHENKVDFEPRTSNQYGGTVTLLMDNGEEVIVERIKRASSSKLTVTFNDGRIGGEKELAEILQNIDRDLFERVFSYNLDGLAEVFKLNEDEIGRFLMHTGVTGSDKLRTIEDSLIKDAGDIFKKSGSKPPLNAKLKRLDTISKALNEAKEKEGSYSTLLALKSEITVNIESTKAEIERLKLQEKDLKEKKNLFKDEINRKILEKKIAELSLVKFPANGRTRMDELVSKEAPLISIVQKKMIQIEGLKAKLARETINEKSLSFSNQIEESGNAAYRISELSKELILLEERLNTINAQISSLESELGINMSEEFLATADLSVAVKNEIEDICAVWRKFEDNSERVDREIIEIKGELNSLGEIRTVDGKRSSFSFISIMMIVMSVVAILLEMKGTAILVLILALIFILMSMKGSQDGNNEDSLQLERIKSRLEAKKLEQVELQKVETQLVNRKAEVSRRLGIVNSLNVNVILRVYNGMISLRNLYSERNGLERKFENKHASSIELKRAIQELGDSIGVSKHGDPQVTALEMKRTLEESKISKLNMQNLLKQTEEVIEELTTSKIELTQVRSEISELLTFSGVDNVEDFKILAEKVLELKDYQKELDLTLSKLNGVRFGDLSELALDEKLEGARSELETKSEELDHLRKSEAEVHYSLSEMEEHGTVEEITQRQVQELEQFNTSAREWMKLSLAKGILAMAVDEFKTTRLPSVVEKANEYLAFMTRGKYRQIVFSEENGLFVIDSEGLNTRARDLSRGTSELLYTALKLAFVYSFQKQKLCPIILDDAFVNFDNQRADRIIDLLNKISSEQQVIFFTCHEHLLEKFNSENVIILKS